MYNYQGKQQIHALIFNTPDSAAGFSKDSLLCLSDKQLQILRVVKFGDVYNSEALKLDHSPRKLLQAKNGNFVIL